MVELPTEIHREHYEVMSVENLGMLFHYLLPIAIRPSYNEGFYQSWRSYREVNVIFAEAVRRLPAAAPIMVQDFHLMCVGEELRSRRRQASPPLLYFHHIPWCDPDYFALLPAEVRDEILRALLAYDVIGFHSSKWARAFLACCERFLPDARRIDSEMSWNGRRVRVIAQPAGVDVEWLRSKANSTKCLSWDGGHWAVWTELISGRTFFGVLRPSRLFLFEGRISWTRFGSWPSRPQLGAGFPNIGTTSTDAERPFDGSIIGSRVVVLWSMDP
jgi:trehalose-6-phosphate synthase